MGNKDGDEDERIENPSKIKKKIVKVRISGTENERISHTQKKEERKKER